MKNKKGFTLIELIVALAIFAISFVAISASFMTSLNFRNIGSRKIDTMNYAQAIAEKYKAHSGIAALKDTSGYYFYFDDINSFDIDNPEEASVSDNTYKSPVSKTKYGAFLSITLDSPNIYKIYINVWEIDKGSVGESKMDVFIYE